MLEPVESKGVGLQGTPLFKDWSSYGTDMVSPQLPKNIKYTPPKPNEDLRRRIKPIENQLPEKEKKLLEWSLSFLEKGILEDDFGKNDWERDEFLLSQTIRIGEEEITLFQLAKEVNKFSINALTRVVTAGQLIGEQNIITRSKELEKKVKDIDKKRGFFLVSDLPEIDSLALSIIEHILGQNQLSTE